MFSSISHPDERIEVLTMDMRVGDVVISTFADIMLIMSTGVVVVAAATAIGFAMPVPLEGSIPLSCCPMAVFDCVSVLQAQMPSAHV